ncbi:MAG: XdhC family protein [Janthinobacterium lividum]
MSFRERREVVSLYGDYQADASGGVLFSLLRVGGSSYRQPGARLLALPDGRTAGTLSGGCLEADLLRRAAWTVRDGAVIEHFSTAFDDTAEIPYGLGCGGELDLLAEAVDTPEAAALLQAMAATLQQGERWIATILPTARSAGRGSLQRIVLDARGDVLFASESLPTEDVVLLRHLARHVEGDSDCVWTESSLGTLCLERLRRVQRLIIFGAGEDSKPLARLATEMGWHAVLVDTRANRASEARFPAGECVISSTAAGVPVQREDAVVLMTHSYQQDGALLAELLAAPPAYLGLLGARHRSALLLQEACSVAGISLAEAVEHTHAPVGLRLGGDGPEAVALAIVAQVQQVLAGLNVSGLASRRLTLEGAEALLADGPSSTLYVNCALNTLNDAQTVPAVAR